MAEEFQESEVIFSDKNFTRTEEDFLFGFREVEIGNRDSKRRKTKGVKRQNVHVSKSLPVDVPENEEYSGKWRIPSERFSDEEDSGDGKIVPPHLIAGRRIEGQMAFSLCTGNGRIKGRDLNRVRNSVLRMTGFLEA